MPSPFHALLGSRPAVCRTETLRASSPTMGRRRPRAKRTDRTVLAVCGKSACRRDPNPLRSVFPCAQAAVCQSPSLLQDGGQTWAGEWMEERDSRSTVSSALGRGSLESWTWAQSHHELSPAKEPECLVPGFSKGTEYAYIRLPLLVHISVNFPLMHL